MVLGKAFPKGGGFFYEIGVVTGLRPIERRFQQTGIPNAVQAAVALDLVGKDGEHLGQGEVVPHFASFL